MRSLLRPGGRLYLDELIARMSTPVEPSAPNQEVPIAKRPERIQRIPRRNHHTVARTQVPLSDFIKGTRIVGDRFERLDDAGQNLNP